MIENIKTNEQKLDEIYHIIKDQESRAMRAKWLRLLKWVIILVIVYYVSQNPEVVLSKITDLIIPMVMDNMQEQMSGSG